MDIIHVGKLLVDYVSRIIILDETLDVIWLSPMAEKINPKNKTKKHFSEMFPISIDAVTRKSEVIKTPYGKKYKVKAQKFTSEKKKYFIVFFEDIEEFSNDKVKLHCMEQMIESINDGIIMSSAEGRVVLYNSAQEKLEKLSAKNILGKYLWEVYDYKAEEITKLSEHGRVFDTGIPIENKYKAHSFRGGIPKYLSYSTYPLKMGDETIGVYSISRNETELKSLLSETIDLKRRLRSDSGENIKNYKENGTTYSFSDIIGESEEISNLINEAENMALLENNLLIIGETGTGKEVFAQSIHNLGKNKKEPFVAVNCAAIPENLLESILFGTVTGSYTGAIDQPGLFEEAKGGTLFLDELNSMPIAMQTKLLRVLQEKRVRRVGALKTDSINCRVISAINEDPNEIIKSGKLRQDLFYRIASLCLFIPPIRERKLDILSLGRFFIKKYNELLQKNVVSYSFELSEVLLNYSWPGNTRELEHVIENLMIRVKDDEVELRIDHLPKYMNVMIFSEKISTKINKQEDTLPNTLRAIEKRIILESLNKNKWNFTRTSNDLGIIRQSLKYRMKKLDITEI